ncbi:hypothetical protein BR93DRAFT_707543 [Coniochaeta sp. PMI_546]|nr:hypothetical protein BR93DRAFT_707543 [Coniochaeta sp. PMI_546]
MNSTADTTNGLATPPLPAAQPLVYITGSPTANKQCVAEYLSLLLGDQAILIDQPSTSTRTPPPPSSTPPTEQTTFPPRQRPRSLRISSSSSRSSRSRSTSATTTATQHPPSSSLNPLLAALSSQPDRTAILTDINRDSPDPNPIVPSQAASQTGRPLIHVQLAAQEPPQPPPAPHPVPATLVLPASEDPHAAALRIVELVKEMDARSRSQGSWGPVNDAPESRGRGGDCVCGVITPLLTPAEEREVTF